MHPLCSLKDVLELFSLQEPHVWAIPFQAMADTVSLDALREALRAHQRRFDAQEDKAVTHTLWILPDGRRLVVITDLTLRHYVEIAPADRTELWTHRF